MTDFTFCLWIEFKISHPTQGGFGVHPMKILRFNFVKTFAQVHTNVQCYISIYPYSAHFFIPHSRERGAEKKEEETAHYITRIVSNWSNAIHPLHRNAFANFWISSRQLSHAGLIFIGSPTSHFECILFFIHLQEEKTSGMFA